MLNKRSLSDVIPEPVWGWRSKKEDARQVEFVRVGQVRNNKEVMMECDINASQCKAIISCLAVFAVLFWARDFKTSSHITSKIPF